MAPETKVNPHVDKGKVSSVIKIAGQGHLAETFLTAGKSFDEALGKGIIRDEEQANALSLVFSWMMRHGIDESILTTWLKTRPAIGGYNRSAAIMDDTQTFTPSGLGMKDTKEHEKAIKELRDEKYRRRDDDRD
jgi:hypothetical protein